MEELTAALAGSFQVTHHPNNPAAPHPRFQSLYKTKGCVLDQHERRRRAIQHQKKGRFDQLSLMRKLADNVWDEKPDRGDGEEDMETAPPAKRRPGNRYKNQLMLSEWLLETPENFETDWVMVPCPVGRRNLVIAARGQTYAYAKSGYLMMQFPSALPGGQRGAGWEDVTILDCVFVESMKTFFVLDMMCWKSHPIYDTETEFRFFWLNSQLQELPRVTRITKGNHYKFAALPNFACEKDNIEGVMMSKLTTELDGLLFYHKLTHYTFGATPLVLWLKAYMMPEVLGIQIATYHLAQKPASYRSFGTHVERVKKDRELGKKGKKSHGYDRSTNTSTVTPGLLEPENYPQELNGGYHYERPRRNRTYSEGASKKGGESKGHKTHGGRSPGAQVPNTKPAVSKETAAPSLNNDGFAFGAQDIRVKDGEVFVSPTGTMEVSSHSENRAQGGSWGATSASQSYHYAPNQSSQSEQLSEDTMDGVQPGKKKRGKRNKKKHSTEASMDM